MDDRHLPDDLRDLEQRLRRESDVSEIELDELRRRIRSHTSRTRRGLMPRRFVSALVTMALVGSGSTAVVLAAKGGSPGPPSKPPHEKQYCPSSSPGGGNPKKQNGNECGHP
jgi:hypothetical protein